MATLYTHKTNNIRRTWLLMGAFVSLIMLIGWVLSYALNQNAIFPIAVGFAVLSSVFSYWFSDKMVIALSGAKPLAKQDDPELYRLVENLSIAAGLPTPKLYMVNETAPNAFATGRDAKHAIVAVTRGLRERLDKSELEGVLAHELSHIGNKDMLVATIAAVLAGVIVTLVNIFSRMMWFGGGRSDRREGGNPLAIIGLIVVFILGPLAATLLRLAISRRREFLADASGALLTRYPEGLANALRKIASSPMPMRHEPDAISHLWLSDPKAAYGKKTSGFAALFMTHPPIEARIRALEDMAV